MKKIFIMTGELSGDKLGGWYLDRLKSQHPDSAGEQHIHVESVGGDFLAGAGAQLYARFETLNVTGLIEIISKLSHILKFLKQVTTYIIDNNFDEVILIDFPGFNLRLAAALKKRNPNIKITYFSPPQLWCWGAWRIKKLKKYCDKLIVLYPFEVDWYKKRGLEVEFIGSPVYDRLARYFPLADEPKKRYVAIIPGSRTAEIENMFSVFACVMKNFFMQYSDVICVVPLARSLPQELIEKKITQAGLDQYRGRIRLVHDEEEKYRMLSQCAIAVTKPGTVTLELALLGVPSIVLFKTSWVNYILLRPFVRVRYMALPNLLLNKMVFPEFIQGDCVPWRISKQATENFESFISCGGQYRYKQQEILRLRTELSGVKK